MLFAILFSATTIADDLTVVQTAAEADYMVIDVSGGKDAASYPVTYYKAAQGVTSAVFNVDEYKLHKIVFKKVIVGDFLQTDAVDPAPYTFRMGNCNTETGNAWHPVRLTKNYWLGVFEVTQQQYKDVIGSNPSYLTTVGSTLASIIAEAGSMGTHPVESLVYDTIAVAETGFLAKLSSKSGVTIGCPTEAQWEYACRAGTSTVYAWGTDALTTEGTRIEDQYAWHNYTSNPNAGVEGRAHHRVGELLPNNWGFYDMCGNVNEYCSDIYGNLSASTTVVSEDPTGAASGANRVVRGGAFSRPWIQLACGDRQQQASDSNGGSGYGNWLRCAMGIRVASVIQ